MVGGSILGISIAGQDFAVAADSDAKLRLGGVKLTERKFGNGTTAFTGETESWSLANLDVAVDASRGQLQFLQSVASQMDLFPCTVTLIDGTVYSGMGQIVDSQDFSTAKSIVTVNLVGSGQLVAQSSSDSFF